VKNQDGIVIKVGQVWAYDNGTKVYKHEIVGFHNNMAVSYCRETLTLDHLDPSNEKYVLTKSHNGADLEQARKDGWKIWVEGMDKPDPLKIEDAHFWSGAGGRMKRREVSTDFYPDDVYFYKLEPQEPELIYCMRAISGAWSKITAPGDQRELKLLPTKIEKDGKEYDVIQTLEHANGKPYGPEQLWLGRWNDGPKKP